jgi:hypothetical protein
LGYIPFDVLCRLEVCARNASDREHVEIEVESPLSPPSQPVQCPVVDDNDQRTGFKSRVFYFTHSLHHVSSPAPLLILTFLPLLFALSLVSITYEQHALCLDWAH